MSFDPIQAGMGRTGGRSVPTTASIGMSFITICRAREKAESTNSGKRAKEQPPKPSRACALPTDYRCDFPTQDQQPTRWLESPAEVAAELARFTIDWNTML